MSGLREEGGFTLPELMIGMLLTLIVISATLATLEQFTQMGKRSERRVDLQEQARQATRQMSRTLRNVAGSSETADVIERAEPYDLVFKIVSDDAAAAPNDLRLQRVRYCLDDAGSIREQVQTWSTPTVPEGPAGTACPAAGWDSSRVVADQVTNRGPGAERPVWTYRHTNGQVSAISISLFTDDDAATQPHEVALKTGVFLRNQNRPPRASFTATPAGINHVLLNGSASFDPEGHPLDMEWTVDGQKVGEGVNLDWDARSPGTRTITLTVSDPSGLSASVSQTVVI